MTEQKGFVDFNIGSGDTGQDNLASIQPLVTGEGATQDVLRRPSENLRERTETLRDQVKELLHYRDYDHLMIEYSGGTITWNGPAPGTAPLGQITVTGGNFIIAPMLAPSAAKKASIAIGTAAVDQITYTVAASAYATHGMNAVTITHNDAGASAALSVTISTGPVKRIVVNFDSTNVAHDAAAVKSAVDIAIAADTDLAGKITTATSALANNTVAAQAETRFEGTADDEKHVITGSHIQTLTTTTPLQAGMGVAIWYRYLIEPSGGYGSDPKAGLAGGRAESSGSRGTSAIPSAALFVTDSNPEKIPGAIPLCRVGYNGQLIFYDGTRLEAGEAFQYKSVVYQVNALATTLANGTGTGIGVNTSFTTDVVSATNGGGIGTSVTTLSNALTRINTGLIRRRAFTAVITDNSYTTGGDYSDGEAVNKILDNTFANGGTFLVRRGYYSLTTPYTATGANNYSHVIGEGWGKHTAGGSSEVTIASGLSTHMVLQGRWENIRFSPFGATYGNTANGRTELINCAVVFGKFIIPSDCDFYAEGCLFEGYTPLTGSDRLTIRGNATFKRCKFDWNGYWSSVENIVIDADIANGPTRISFEDCEFTTTVRSSFHALVHITGDAGARYVLTFKNCTFNDSDSSYNSASYLIQVASASYRVLFENCRFYKERGSLLHAPKSNVLFKNCYFETGNTAFTGYGAIAGFGTAESSSYGPFVESATFGFENCVAVLGTTSIDAYHTAITIGGELGGDPPGEDVTVAYHVDGLYVRYKTGVTTPPTNVLRFRSDHSAVVSYEHRPACFVRNVKVDNGNLPTYFIDDYLVSVLGYTNDTANSKGQIYVENLEICGVSKASGANGKGILHAREAQLKNVLINITTNGNTGSYNPTNGIVLLESATIDGIRVTGLSTLVLSGTTTWFYVKGRDSATGTPRHARIRRLMVDAITTLTSTAPLIRLGHNASIEDSEIYNVNVPVSGNGLVINAASVNYTNVINTIITVSGSGNENHEPLINLNGCKGVKVLGNTLIYADGATNTAINLPSPTTGVVNGNVLGVVANVAAPQIVAPDMTPSGNAALNQVVLP